MGWGNTRWGDAMGIGTDRRAVYYAEAFIETVMGLEEQGR